MISKNDRRVTIQNVLINWNLVGCKILSSVMRDRCDLLHSYLVGVICSIYLIGGVISGSVM